MLAYLGFVIRYGSLQFGQGVFIPFGKFRHRLNVKLPAYGAVFFRFTPDKKDPKGANE